MALCPGMTTCAGDECCPDGSPCPSASPNFKGCRKPRAEVSNATCPDGSACGGNQCCPDGSTCPSASKHFDKCPFPKPIPTDVSTTVPAVVTTCEFGDVVHCAGGSFCAGNSCCPDTSTCPSASKHFTGCPLPKLDDCLQAPLSKSHGAACEPGDSVTCPTGETCSGNSCCADGSTCPSAYPSFDRCQNDKITDCLSPDAPWAPLPQTECPDNSTLCQGNSCCPDGSTCPAAADDFRACKLPKKRKYQLPVRNSTARGCLPFESVECPGSNGKSCAGNACCPDGSVCPSAENDFFGCHYSKRLDCTGLPTETALPSVALIALFV